MANMSTVPRNILSFRFSTVGCRLCSTSTKTQEGNEDNFRKLKIHGLHDIFEPRKKRGSRRVERPPRFKRMKVDQDWISVWPTASSFKWSAVPFPVRQGFVKNMAENFGLIPEKYANVELMKIPNFLHLTPPHIVRQCRALKEFCTPWPKGLTEEKCSKLFPIESVTSDYCFASNKIRDPRARTVTVKFNMSSLKLDAHGKDKFKRLVGDRYNNGEITLTSDRCPLKIQNFDYMNYLITVLYYESNVKEEWEEKEFSDRDDVMWSKEETKQRIEKLMLKQKGKGDEEEDLDKVMNSHEYRNFEQKAVHLLHVEETETSIEQYKNSVLDLLNISRLPESS